MVALRSQGNGRWEGPLGTPLGLVHWNLALSFGFRGWGVSALLWDILENKSLGELPRGQHFTLFFTCLWMDRWMRDF